MAPSEPIAIVGSSCRFAGQANSPSKLWQLLCNPLDLAREPPSGRFNGTAFYHPDPEYHGTTNSIKAYWLEQSPGVFDANFFNINPREAEAMDPQQRILLEIVFEALDSAGISVAQYSGKPVGVFSGCMTQDYETLSQRDELTASKYFPTGNSRAVMSNRISYFYNFQGPSMTIDTACSSSLVALNQAVLSLRAGSSELACVTGANLLLVPENFIVESSLHMLSPTGNCRMWDDRADGYARGEGFACVLLKTLSRALADGDEIEGVIRGVDCNADGKTSGITMPNSAAQANLIRQTYQNAGLDPTDFAGRCQYFEAHGTGTAAGDPREAAAIHAAFYEKPPSDENSKESRDLPAPTEKLWVGSVKTVIGHTESSAGLAGILKVIACMKHGQITPNLHFKTLNPQVVPYYTNLRVPTAIVPWPDPPPGQPRRASVNSFGFGGANAHAIVELYDPKIHLAIIRSTYPSSASRPEALVPARQSSDHSTSDDASSATRFYLPLVISAASPKALPDVARSYLGYLDGNTTDVHRLSWHLYSRRAALPYRVTMSVASQEEALETLHSLLSSNEPTLPGAHIIRDGAATKTIRILGVFTGQGAQWPTMSLSLLQQNNVYRRTIRNLDAILKGCPHPPSWTLEEQIMAAKGTSRVNEAAVSQPLCVAIQIALVNMMRSIGIDFHTVVGHSSGEIAAAYTAARLSARDAILIAYYRGMVAHTAAGTDKQKGGMIAVGMSESEAAGLLDDPLFSGRVTLAANNSPNSITLSGDLDAINQMHKHLKKQHVFNRILVVEAGYHSYHMTGPAVAYAQVLRGSGVSSSSEGNEVVWVSSVDGRPRTSQTDLDSGYWVDNILSTVRFREAVEYALTTTDGFDCAIEIGPHPALQGPVAQTATEMGTQNLLYLCPLNRSKDSSLSFSDFLGNMWSIFGSSKVDLNTYISQCRGQTVDRSRLIGLPPYPFDHSTVHWRESRLSRQYHFKTAAPHELLGVRSREDNAYELKWRNVLKRERLPWLEHHSFQGQALLPASGYCIMALDAARSILDGRPASIIEIRDMQILSGISIEKESAGVETLFSLSIAPGAKKLQASKVIDATFSLYSCPVDSEPKMEKHVTGSLQVILGDPSVDALPSRHTQLSETMPADPEEFYQMMEGTGLAYTGPFRAIRSIRRRYRYCSATLSRVHPQECTSLDISPATLDACFQSAFLAYASPGDRSLWTSFLPTSIDRIRFSLAALNESTGRAKDDILAVDAEIVRRMYPDRATTSILAVDISVFNEKKEAEVQVEGLSVRALANNQPKDDAEFYLHTIMDIDPTDEIVGVDSAALEGEDVLLAESCSRIISFQLEQRRGEASETKASIDKMILDSKHAGYLESVQRAAQDDVIRLTEKMPSIIEEAHRVSNFLNHIGRIAKQIAHKYPWMNILYLANSELQLLKPVLSAIDSAYQSFSVAVIRNTPADEVKTFTDPDIDAIQMHALQPHERLPDRLDPNRSQDLVLLSTEIFRHKDPGALFQEVRELMRPGAFLMLVNLYGTVCSGCYPGHVAEPPTPPHWVDVLNDCGFIQQSRNSDQFHKAGHIIVRQLREKSLTKLSSLKIGPLVEDLLLVHAYQEGADHDAVTTLENLLAPSCGNILSRSLDGASTNELETCTAAIVLADLAESIMLNMTEHRVQQLRSLLQPNATVLWLTCNARIDNPGNAASLGFLRTLQAEVPSLKLQALDLELDDLEFPSDLVSKTFLRLVSTTRHMLQNSLANVEPEIYMEEGHRLVPRVVPLKQFNDRANAWRRVVTRPLNTLRECVEIAPSVVSNCEVQFNAQETRPPLVSTPKRSVLIQVDYSSALPFRLDEQVSAYVCVGRELKTGVLMAALSSINASCIVCPSAHAFVLRGEANSEFATLHRLIRFIAAVSAAWFNPYQHQIILIEPDVEFAQCLVDVTAPRGSLSSRVAILETQNYSEGCSPYFGIKAAQMRHHQSSYLHPQTPARALRGLFFRHASVFNFLTEDAGFSYRISESVQDRDDYYSGVDMFSTSHLMNDVDFSTVKPLWKFAVMLTEQSARERPRVGRKESGISVDRLVSQTNRFDPFQIIDWKRDRDTVQVIKPLVSPSLLSPDKTYILFGMTRDLGQSLCRLFLEHGARNIVLASRSPDTSPNWIEIEMRAFHADIRIERADVTKPNSLKGLKGRLAETMPPVGGIINGAMVLDDRVFAQMTSETWNRVLQPKTMGSMNLHHVFSETDLEFFIMTSSFAAIGGHPGQANYAAANMYMNGLAASRRLRGLAVSVLNIGAIYGIGYLHREKAHLYAGLEREGYPPVSEHDVHHMFLEAIVAGKPNVPGQPVDITTGLARFRRGEQHPLHWHRDPRFGHFALRKDPGADAADSAKEAARKSLVDQLAELTEVKEIADAIGVALVGRLRVLLGLADDAIDRNSSPLTIGMDSLVAVEVRNWFFETLGMQVAVMKILNVPSINHLCGDAAAQICKERVETGSAH
ncbi:beta-ketoacyl synthase domain-containing protein [Xylariaceae sp. FL1019]|nr:beta-ketoacyl synthase domain-containing protein [Xylariaceae sp. FL1019]